MQTWFQQVVEIRVGGMKSIVDSRKMRRKGILELIIGKDKDICALCKCTITNVLFVVVVSISIPNC